MFIMLMLFLQYCYVTIFSYFSIYILLLFKKEINLLQGKEQLYVAQWLRWRTSPSEPGFRSCWYAHESSVAAGWVGIWPKLLPCASESPTYLGSHIWAREQGSQQCQILTLFHGVAIQQFWSNL